MCYDAGHVAIVVRVARQREDSERRGMGAGGTDEREEAESSIISADNLCAIPAHRLGALRRILRYTRHHTFPGPSSSCVENNASQVHTADKTNDNIPSTPSR